MSAPNPADRAAVVAAAMPASLRALVEQCDAVYADAPKQSLTSSILFLVIHVLTSLLSMLAHLEKHPSKIVAASPVCVSLVPGSATLWASISEAPRKRASLSDADVRELLENFVFDSRSLARKLNTPLANEVERAVYELAVKHGAAPPGDDWRSRVAEVEARQHGGREVMS
ncbi:MAG: hypothetical protein U0165_03495 [Polyangiaceae bacterium]